MMSPFLFLARPAPVYPVGFRSEFPVPAVLFEVPMPAGRPPLPPPPAPETLQGIGEGIRTLLVKAQSADEKADRRHAKSTADIAQVHEEVLYHGVRLKRVEETLEQHAERIVDLERRRRDMVTSRDEGLRVEVPKPGQYRTAPGALMVAPPHAPAHVKPSLAEARDVVFKSIPPAASAGFKETLERGNTGSFRVPEDQLDKLLAEREAAKQLAAFNAEKLVTAQRWNAVKTAVAVAAVLTLGGLAVRALVDQATKGTPEKVHEHP